VALVHHDGVAHRYAALRGGLVRWIERNHHRDSRRQAVAAAAAAAGGFIVAVLRVNPRIQEVCLLIPCELGFCRSGKTGGCLDAKLGFRYFWTLKIFFELFVLKWTI
jgi:hypothetical protein